MYPIANFQHFETHHCVTGSLRHIYVHNDHPLSEELLLGLGEGVGFIYWHQKGQPPFLGGRAQPKPSLEEITAQRTGVKVTARTTSSAKKAETTLLESLTAETPVMVQVDMGFLPYFDFGDTDYHFGGHVVVACGYDAESGQVLIADRDAALHPIPLEDLAKARGSTFKPFPPKNRWLSFDFSEKRLPTTDEINTAIANQVERMLNPPISNFGVKGIRKSAKLVPTWKDIMSVEDLKWALFNLYIFISPVGGTGGGTFRYMFGRFLAEAAELTGNPALNASAEQFKQVGDSWEAIGEWAKITSEADKPDESLSDVRPMLSTVADQEEAAWQALREVVPMDLVSV